MRLFRNWGRRCPVVPGSASLGVEALEDRLALSWGGVPPSTIAVPASAFAATLNSSGDATGNASISANEIDWYRFSTGGGSFTISATTPTSNLDTVIGLYNSSGQRVAYNDDVSYYNFDSQTTVTLAAGTYYLGVTNYMGTAGGTYTWRYTAVAPGEVRLRLSYLRSWEQDTPPLRTFEVMVTVK